MVIRNSAYAVLMSAMAACLSACGSGSACAPSGDYAGFVCDLQNAEDLVQVPDTDWIIASGMSPAAAIYLIDSEARSGRPLYPGASPQARHDRATYPSCPGAPDTSNFITHGLNLRSTGPQQAMLYAVSHGGREAIEVFEVDASGRAPELTWIGCVPMPPGLDANSVASFSDGSLVATVLIHPGRSFRDLIAGEPTGAVYEWSPGSEGFELVQGTELPGNNGIEVSADDREIFVVSSGLSTVVAFTHSNPARLMRTTRRMAFTPDNVHMGADGRLVTAGMVNDEPSCGGFPSPEEFDIAAMAACPRGFIAVAIDPANMQDEVIAEATANPDLSNATMALEVGNEVWVGTFSGNRIGFVERN